MASNPYANKLIVSGVTKLDLSNDTVTADKLMQGYTAHDRTGAVITGTASGAESYTVNLGAMPNNVDKAYVKDSEGIKYTNSNTSFTVQEGEQLNVYVYGTSSTTSYIYYNNVLVASGTYDVAYNFNMPKYDIDVSVSGDNTNGRTMRISTPMLAINKNGYHNVENYGFVDVQAAPTYTATFITTSGSSSSNYVSYTDASGLTTKYYSVGSTFTFSAGDTATFVGTYAGACKRYLNGELISTDTNYVYTLPACNIEIQLQNYNSPSSQYALQRITTSDGIDALTITQNGTYTASGDTKGYSPITVNVSGGATLVTKNITTNGTYNASSDNADGYSSVTVNVSGGTPSLQNKTVSPTTSQQTVHADSGYDGLDTVTVNAMPTGTAGTPTASKGTVSNHSISVTPSVTNTTGYITGSTKTGTAVTVSASELVSGSETKTENGTYDVTNLANLVVNIPFVTYYTGSGAPSASLGNDGDIYFQS